MTNSLILWIIVGVVALGIDIATSAFIFVWFTVGSIAAIIAQIFDYSFAAQLIIFIGVSGVCTAVGYPMAKKTIKKSVKPTATREKTYIGKLIVVDGDIIEKGLIKVDGVYWSVIKEGDMVQKGDKAEIVGIEGNKIIIKKI
jgi:membrane protein implicated in regulation of membrane protease activity